MKKNEIHKIIEEQIFKEIFQDKVQYPISLSKIINHKKYSYGVFDEPPEGLRIDDKDGNKIGAFLDTKRKRIAVASFIIYKNTKRFSIAHELGHLFLDREKKNHLFYRRKINDYDDPNEGMYNYFAMGLLVLSDKDWKRKSSIYNESEIAKHYGVPLSLVEHIEYFSARDE